MPQAKRFVLWWPLVFPLYRHFGKCRQVYQRKCKKSLKKFKKILFYLVVIIVYVLMLSFLVFFYAYDLSQMWSHVLLISQKYIEFLLGSRHWIRHWGYGGAWDWPASPGLDSKQIIYSLAYWGIWWEKYRVLWEHWSTLEKLNLGETSWSVASWMIF